MQRSIVGKEQRWKYDKDKSGLKNITGSERNDICRKTNLSSEIHPTFHGEFTGIKNE